MSNVAIFCAYPISSPSLVCVKPNFFLNSAIRFTSIHLHASILHFNTPRFTLISCFTTIYSGILWYYYNSVIVNRFLNILFPVFFHKIPYFIKLKIQKSNIHLWFWHSYSIPNVEIQKHYEQAKYSFFSGNRLLLEHSKLYHY